MKVKKSLAIVLTLLVVGQVSTAKAYENTSHISKLNTKKYSKEVTNEKALDNGVVYVNEGFIGTNYSEEFNAYKKEGNTLNVNVKNNGKTNVKFSLYKGKTKIQTVTVSPGGKSRTITIKKSSGVRGEYEIIVSTNDGARMNLYIRARQFNSK